MSEISSILDTLRILTKLHGVNIIILETKDMSDDTRFLVNCLYGNKITQIVITNIFQDIVVIQRIEEINYLYTYGYDDIKILESDINRICAKSRSKK